MTKRFKLIYIVFIAACIIRIGTPLSSHLLLRNSLDNFSNSDTLSYLSPAKSLAFDHKFNNLYGKPDIIRTPGYPLLIAIGERFHHPEIITVFLQSILSCLTIFLIYKMSLKIFNNEFAALVSVFLACLDRVLMDYTYLIGSETLYTFLLTLLLYTIIIYFNNKRLKYIIISSILLAMSIYVRPVGYYMPAYLVISIFLYLIYKRELTKKIILHLLVFFMLCSGLVYLWQIRNHKVARYDGFSAISDINLYYYNACSLLAVQNGITFEDMQEKLALYTLNYNSVGDIIQSVVEAEGIVFENQAQAYKYIRNKAVKIILNDPFTYFKIHLKGMYRILQDKWFPFESIMSLTFDQEEFEVIGLNKSKAKIEPKSSVGLNQVIIRHRAKDFGGITGLLLKRGIKGTIKAFPNEKPFMLFLLYIIYSFGVLLFYAGIAVTIYSKRFDGVFVLTIVIVYILIISGGIWGYDRFRHPILPSFYILGGMGLLIMYNKIKYNSMFKKKF
ncbi:MAG: glycosyltransferase family 39 protein [Nitrospirae bacterium]|nr:glycosyltransferase family 39 protein [Nitrospirota bacterium]